MNCINHPDRPRIAFCQNCGKPLCAECARVVGSAVFDEACLAERLASAPPPFAAGSQAAGPGVPFMPPPGAPNPGLALLLGLLPGVGAMYNGQYAKGVVHLVVFAVLVSLSDHNGVFGLFVAGWIFYQMFEAYHTAKARRDGTPLPNPFGLNDLGERLGFGKAWGAVSSADPTHPASGAGFSGSAGPSPYTGVPPAAETSGPAASAAEQSYATASAAGTGGNPYAAPGSNPYAAWTGVPPAGGPGTQWGSQWGSPAESYASVYAAGAPVPPPAFSARPNRFPVGALVLIGLGVLFLIGNTGWIEGFPVYRLFPFLLIGLGVWLFVRRMLETGHGLADDGSPQYRLRLLRALRGSIWIIVVGVLSFLDSFHILSWGRSWPLFIIAAGVIAFLQRSVLVPAAPGAYSIPVSSVPVSSVPVPPSPAEPASVSRAIVPVDEAGHDQEGV